MTDFFHIWIPGAFSSSLVWNYHKLLLSAKPLNVTHVDVEYDITSDAFWDVVDNTTSQVLHLARTASPNAHYVINGHSYGGVIATAVAAQLIQHGLSRDKITVATFAAPLGGISILPPATLFGSMFGGAEERTFMANVSSTGMAMVKFHQLIDETPDMCLVVCHVATNNHGSVLYPSKMPNDGVVSVNTQTCYVDRPWCKVHPIDCDHFEILVDPDPVDTLSTCYGVR